ncbi:hypothetical protein BDR03DRAFT_542907 [Suillus americanus]|nr:hypothetical protein BDR03DRAFT_542907 [Suillus americanus]
MHTTRLHSRFVLLFAGNSSLLTLAEFQKFCTVSCCRPPTLTARSGLSLQVRNDILGCKTLRVWAQIASQNYCYYLYNRISLLINRSNFFLAATKVELYVDCCYTVLIVRYILTCSMFGPVTLNRGGVLQLNAQSLQECTTLTYSVGFLAKCTTRAYLDVGTTTFTSSTTSILLLAPTLHRRTV